MKKFLIVLVWIVALPNAAQEHDGPLLMWIRPEGGERNEYVFFRKELDLDAIPKKATLHLYADSRYALYVNGMYLGFGPVRSFHAHPYYDTYDLVPYLKEGNNIIAVKALSNGMLTYQLFDYHGGFAAWGQIEMEDGPQVDLSLAQGWTCKKSEGYDQTAPRFSFATGAIENWDTRNEWDWNLAPIDTQGWVPPVPLNNQSLWGSFQSRPIPKLTNRQISPIGLRGSYPLSQAEILYSFRIPTPDLVLQEYNSSHAALAYTYIHSPQEQEVSVGLWWGDHYLNGTLLEKEAVQSRKSYRSQYTLSLNKGWNTYAVRYGIIWGSWDYYMAIPTSAGLSLSSSRQKDSKDLFQTYGPFQTEALEKHVNQLDLTTTIKGLIGNTHAEQWRAQERNEDANQPARDLAWKELDTLTPLKLQENLQGNLVIPPSKKGMALFFEMSETELGRIFVEGDFPTGTQIDIGFSEELDKNGFPWLYKRFQIGAGVRFVAHESKKRYESFKPYGLKYLHINISNHETAVTLRNVGVLRQVYPFEKVGHFECSDPIFNKIWEAGWRTLQLCAEDSYTDTPFRERGLYAGDMLPQAAITMAVSGDMRLTAHSLRVFQDMYREEMALGKENRHNDFPLITQLTLDYYCHYQNDWSLAKEFYNNYASLLRHHIAKKDEKGLIAASRVFLEWTQINRENAAMTAYQALLAKSMETQAQWAGRFGFSRDEIYFTEEAQKLRQATNQFLWDPQKKVYRDGMKSGALLSENRPTSNIWPMLYGVTNPEQEPHILEFLERELQDIGSESRKRKITPYSSFYLFALLYKYGKAGFAEYFMKKHWAPMALHSSSPTVWENFDIRGNQGTSSHAWSGHPTYFLSTEVLGVNLGVHKNFDRNVIEICPQSETLSWASGTVAHPAGPVYVKWEIRGDLLFLRYRVPKNVRVSIAPKGRLGNLQLITEQLP